GEPRKTTLAIPLTESLKEALNNAAWAHYQLVINSAENEHVKIYSTDLLEFKIVGDFEYLLEQ
ncbi:MAG: hypothetical protein KDC05_03210, partial [Bacteroidales bacterium]|nr:hypothetical protein [Bacteroidales bacterium]